MSIFLTRYLYNISILKIARRYFRHAFFISII
nr:MAG TPA: hypothetical protein [Caudoviricetes sp.]